MKENIIKTNTFYAFIEGISSKIAVCIYPILILIYMVCYYLIQMFQRNSLFKFFPQVELEFSKLSGTSFITALIMSILLGYAQWYVLRHASTRSKGSIWINAVSWLLSIGLGWMLVDWLNHLSLFPAVSHGMPLTLGDVFWPTPNMALASSLILLYIIFIALFVSQRLSKWKKHTNLYKFVNKIWWLLTQLIVWGISVVTIALFIGELLPMIHSTHILLSRVKSEQIAIQYFVDKYQIPAKNIRVGHAITPRYPETERFLWRAKLFEYTRDNRTAPKMVTIDRENGTIIDGEVAEQREQEAHKAKLAKYGKFSIRLYNLLQTIEEDELVSITIWLGVNTDIIREEIISHYPDANFNGFRPTKETDLELYEQIKAEIREAKRVAYQQVAESIIAKLDSQDIEISYNPMPPPKIYTRLSKQSILELSEWQGISKVRLNAD